MNARCPSKLAVAVTASLTIAALTAQAAQPPGKPPPKPEALVRLSIEAPQNKKDLPTPRTYSSGWVLALKLEASASALGIAASQAPMTFPGTHDTGYVVFSDPDGCLALPPPFVRPDECVGLPTDETYLEFTNDVDQVGQPDYASNPERAAALADPAQSGAQTFIGWEDPVPDGNGGFSEPGHPAAYTVGPATGGTTADGVGYGADDDLPGLVLFSDTGPGRTYNADYSPVAPRQLRNLAGFLSLVGYTLREPGGKTTVYASMLVPYGLVAPVMFADDCVGPGAPFCTGAPKYRLDGGPVTVGTAPSAQSYPDLFDARSFVLRAFVVSGTAPSVLQDADGDGDVDAGDATLAGYRVISSEETVKLRQYHDTVCAVGLANVVYADFDGNGSAQYPYPCPAGPGQITPPPD